MKLKTQWNYTYFKNKKKTMKNNTKEVQLTNENLLILNQLTNEKLAELCLEELTHLNKQALLEELENLLLSIAERGFDLKLLHTYYMDKVSQTQNNYKF